VLDPHRVVSNFYLRHHVLHRRTPKCAHRHRVVKGG
jgi:hypothetical protein